MPLKKYALLWSAIAIALFLGAPDGLAQRVSGTLEDCSASLQKIKASSQEAITFQRRFLKASSSLKADLDMTSSFMGTREYLGPQNYRNPDTDTLVWYSLNQNINAIVSRIFIQILGRTPNQVEESYYRNLMNDVLSSRNCGSNFCTYNNDLGLATSISARKIMDSNEARLTQVARWYSFYLGRPQSISTLKYIPGIQDWANLLAHPRSSTKEILSGFLASPEFYLVSGNTPSNFIRALYRKLWFREATSEEVRAWMSIGVDYTNMNLRRDIAFTMLRDDQGLEMSIALLMSYLLRRDGSRCEIVFGS